MFALDYLVRVALAKDRPRYISGHVPDLAMIALPVLPAAAAAAGGDAAAADEPASHGQPAGQGRSLRARLHRAHHLLRRAGRARRRAAQQPGANITSFGDALWWAASTITTVGYGDRFPVTTQGRFVAVGLMLAGIALLGVVTASIASWLIDRVREVETEAVRDTADDLAALRRQLELLTAEVAALRAERAQADLGS